MGKLTKEEFESLLAQAGLKKKDLCDILDVAPGVVSSWTSKGREPPYWVKSWLENYIAAKAAKTDPVLAPIGDWYETYKGFLNLGAADDMHIFFRRGNDVVVNGKRYPEITLFGHILERGKIIMEFKPICTPIIRMNEQVTKNAERRKLARDFLELKLRNGDQQQIQQNTYEDIPYYANDYHDDPDPK
ncbi:hypothetical protein [Hydrogenimonas sp.]